MSGIYLSTKHGVNPSMGVCFYCGEEDGTIILPGRLKDDAEAPRRAVWTRKPCPKCKALMRQGVMFISVRDSESGDNPYRTGRLAVVTDEAVSRIVKPEGLRANILRRRVAFIPDTVWTALGLPEEAAT